MLSAPAELLSDPDGQVRPTGAQGLYVGDTRFCNRLEIGVDGVVLHPVGSGLDGASRAWFAGELRGGSTVVRVHRDRRLADRSAFEEVELHNAGATAIGLQLVLRARSDLAATPVVKSGVTVESVAPLVDVRGVRWARGRLSAALGVEPAAAEAATDGRDAVLTWPLNLEPGDRWTLRVAVEPSPAGPEEFRPAAPIRWRRPDVGLGRRAELLERSFADLDGLLLADPLRPADRFAAAGSPWFCTLFGRDSLWTARMMLPHSTELPPARCAPSPAVRARRRTAGRRRSPGRSSTSSGPAACAPAGSTCPRATTGRSTRPRCGAACCTTRGAPGCPTTRWRRCCPTSKPRSRGWTAPPVPTASSPTAARPAAGWPTRAGRTRPAPCAGPTARSPNARWRSARCRATRTRRPRAARRCWRRSGGRARPSGASGPTASPTGSARRSGSRTGRAATPRSRWTGTTARSPGPRRTWATCSPAACSPTTRPSSSPTG
ncbi:hypothetical protein BJF78_03615 [Pseudonocardia sp. CNS-139]|nr:hypothetical protein BJF78_03615 [Pseudonocardia sp. CNS-139]